MQPIARFLERFPHAKKLHSGWYQDKCIAHEDQHASFGFKEQPDGHLLLKCLAGCTQEAILSALNLHTRDLYPNSEVQSNDHLLYYTYQDAKGKTTFQVVRGENKKFWQRRPDGMGGWINNMQGVTRVLYHLPEVQAAVKSGGIVWLVEGEKDADNLGKIGLTATTNPGGAGKWQPQYGRMLAGTRVAILPDNDDAGEKHARMIAEDLRGKVEELRIVYLPDLPARGDVSDWLAAGGTREQLEQIALEAEEILPVEPGEVAGTKFRCTPIGNAERLAARHGERFRFCSSLDSFIIYDGRRWVSDDTFRTEWMAHETVRSIPEELEGITDPAARTAILGHAARSETDAAISGMLRRTRPLPGVTVRATEFDRDPWLLNCANGTLDLRTGELHQHDPDNHLMKCSPIAYVPGAACPLWMDFLYTAMQGNHALVTFLQRAAGYSLTGIPRERVIFILHGRGRNGKSTFLNVLRHVLGEYSVRTPTSTLLLRRDKGIPNDVARLVGTRLVTAAETSGDSAAEGKLDEALVKDLTGCEAIAARFLHKEFFEFLPVFKLWLGTNHIPTVSGTDDAIWDRIRLVPFNQRFYIQGEDPGPDDLPADLTLQERLYTEAEGVLGWAVQGCLDWQREGLTYPAEVRRAVQNYRADMDTLIGFIGTCCKPGRMEWTYAGTLYDAYCSWCHGEEKHPEPSQILSNRLKAQGFQRIRSGGTVKWYGISLKDSINQDNQDNQDDLRELRQIDASRSGVSETRPGCPGRTTLYEPGEEG